ncbi:MAG: ABC transporter permease [Planctomycetota bacterium]
MVIHPQASPLQASLQMGLETELETGLGSEVGSGLGSGAVVLAAMPDLTLMAFLASLVFLLWHLRSFREFVDDAGAHVMLLAGVLARLHHLPRRRRWFMEQLFAAGIKNLHVVLLVGLFIGMILGLQMGIELSRFGQQDSIGAIVAASMAREMGPFVTAIIMAATVGSRLAAELGTMSVSDELSALKVLSVDRLSFLVLPRVVALAIICPMLTVVCDAVGILGGGFIANSQLHVGWSLYMDSAFETLQDLGAVVPVPMDVYSGLLKAVFFGVIVAVISCTSGFQAHGGALGVGRATSRAVRDSIIAVIVANYFLTWILYQG